MEPEKKCGQDDADIILTCNSFLKIYVTEVAYGRNSTTKKQICDGDLPDDKNKLLVGKIFYLARNLVSYDNIQYLWGRGLPKNFDFSAVKYFLLQLYFKGSCYDDDYNQQLRGEIALQCHGTYNCTFYVPTVPLGDECIGLIRETKVNYICGM